MAISPVVAKVGIGAASAVVGAGLALVLTAGGTATPIPAAMAWIDRPLHGSEVELGPVDITAHVTDPDGIALVSVAVDGAEIVAEPYDGTETLATIETTWTPEATGTYLITVVGSDGSGQQSAPAAATITVVGERAPGLATTTTTTPPPATSTTTTAPPDEPAETTTTTPPPATSTTAPPTTTPPTTAPPTTATTTSTTMTSTSTTAPPCTQQVPVLTGPSGAITSTTPTITWTHDGCPANRFQVEIATNSGFTRIAASGAVPGTDQRWTTPPLAAGPHWVRVRAVFADSTGPWSTPLSFEVASRGP